MIGSAGYNYLATVLTFMKMKEIKNRIGILFHEDNSFRSWNRFPILSHVDNGPDRGIGFRSRSGNGGRKRSSPAR
jgi:hypothetical protein